MTNKLTKPRLQDLVRDTPIFHQPAPETASTNATLTAAQMLGGILVVDQAAGGTSTLTTLTGALLQAAMRQPVIVDESFDLYIINIGLSAGENVILAMGATGMTLVGNNDIEEEDAVANSSSAHFRFRNTGANTFTCYRLA